jgi:dolichyl-diphosphooligosaccharide--protein glycosyltransferase
MTSGTPLGGRVAPPEPAALARWGAALGILLVLGVGFAARMIAWPRIMTARGVRLAFDTDPYYHVLQAERLLAGDGVWFDPAMNWPFGQGVLWPPLLDLVVAGATRLAFGGGASRQDIELVAALLPVPVGLLTVALAIAVGSLLLGRGLGLTAGLLVAVLPAAVLWSSVGAADQHAAEILLSCAAVLSFVLGWRAATAGARRAAAAALGAAVAASFWNWQGSALNLVLPVLFTAAAHVVLPDDEVARRAPRTLTLGLGFGAALLAGTIAVFGPPGALSRGDLAGIGALHVAMTAGAAGLGAVLVLARAARPASAGPGRRLAEVAVAVLAPAALTLGVFPVLRSGVLHGVTALAAGNPWYREIAEYRHLVFSCLYPLSDDLRMFLGTYGLTFVAAALAIPALVRRVRGGGEGRAVVLFLACWAVPLFVLALVRRRFAPYLAIPLALFAAEGLWWTATWVRSRCAPARPGVAIAVAAVAVALMLAPTTTALTEGVTTQLEGDIVAMEWLAEQPSPPGREGVLSTWSLGHLVHYFARKPVLATPFGTDGGASAMLDTARFSLATDPSAAAALLERRRVGFVVLSEPLASALIDEALVPGVSPAVTARCSASAGRSLDVSPSYFDGMAARLFYHDGRAPRGRRVLPIDTQRLVYESEAQRIKIFAATAGAELVIEGARPREEVTVSVFLRTNQGRASAWTTSITAGDDGTASLRVPYATGMNGAIQASASFVQVGARSVPVTLSEHDVVTGARVRVATVAHGGQEDRATPPLTLPAGAL